MKIEEQARVTVTVTLKLDEAEIAALDALAGYGVDNFLEVFYEHMGKSYLQPHEHGLRSLFKGVRDVTPGILSRAQKARAVFKQVRDE